MAIEKLIPDGTTNWAGNFGLRDISFVAQDNGTTPPTQSAGTAPDALAVIAPLSGAVGAYTLNVSSDLLPTPISGVARAYRTCDGAKLLRVVLPGGILVDANANSSTTDVVNRASLSGTFDNVFGTYEGLVNAKGVRLVL